ncbi:MAG: hypothetical protein GY892_01940 [Shimia sp.]|nr:hypothetical protein [Shimia sp.]|tara:strand:+ start:2926 stop:3153 length:228 start_codon:yes stop_codon:yes gene_type:complete
MAAEQPLAKPASVAFHRVTGVSLSQSHGYCNGKLAKRKMTMETDELEADIRTKTEIVNSEASKHQHALKREMTLT